MLTTVFKLVFAASVVALLSACGLARTAMDASVSTAQAVFSTPVETLRLEFVGPQNLNSASADMAALALTTQLRVYQLRDNAGFLKATYEQLLEPTPTFLKGDRLDEQALVIRPGDRESLGVPLLPDARFIAVVALFREPGGEPQNWRLAFTADELDGKLPRTLSLAGDRLTLLPLTEG